MTLESPDKYILSIVIPVTRMAGKLGNLKLSLNSIRGLQGLQVVVVHDVGDPYTQAELRELLEEFKDVESEFIQGHFGSPGAARNAGIGIALGTWITFWDSDDIGDARSIVDDLEKIEPSIKAIVGQSIEINFANQKPSTLRIALYKSDLASYVGFWRIIFLRENLKMFREISMGEDQVFVLENLPEAESIYFSEKCYYTYVTGFGEQLTSNRHKIADLILASCAMLDLSHDLNTRDEAFVAELLGRQLITLMKRGTLIDKVKSIKLFYRFVREFRIGTYVSLVITILNSTRKLKTDTENFVSITGGLGNQLFQLAAAIHLSKGRKLNLITALGEPRKSIAGTADILDFDLSNICQQTTKSHPNFILKKAAGFNLRMGVSPNNLERIKLLDKLIRKAGELLLSRFLHASIRIILGRGVGYCETKQTRKSSLLIGYFQSYKWFLDPFVRSKLSSLTLLKVSAEYEKYREIANGKKVLAIHIRLGDYKFESKFGVLSPHYYELALQNILSKQDFDLIWVFSDEPELAKKYYLRDLTVHLDWINGKSMSAAETLQTMRLCNAYIIGNSSFSWWGAILSNDPTSGVIAPSKWFKDMETPIYLLPDDWTLIEPTYFESGAIKKFGSI